MAQFAIALPSFTGYRWKSTQLDAWGPALFGDTMMQNIEYIAGKDLGEAIVKYSKHTMLGTSLTVKLALNTLWLWQKSTWVRNILIAGAGTVTSGLMWTVYQANRREIMMATQALGRTQLHHPGYQPIYYAKRTGTLPLPPLPYD